jgi:hypothetical protein
MEEADDRLLSDLVHTKGTKFWDDVVTEVGFIFHPASL